MATRRRSTARPIRPYWLGTDGFGRDILSRLIYGARISLLVGIGASLLGVGVGASVGIIAGYRGGWTDIVAQRVMDAMLAFPMLLLGAGHGGGARTGAAQRDHRSCHADRAACGPHRAVQRARAQDDRLHRGSPRDRVQQRADHAPPHPAEHDCAAADHRHRLSRSGDRAGGGARLSRRRHSGAPSLVGPDDVRLRHDACAGGAVDRAFSPGWRSS